MKFNFLHEIRGLKYTKKNYTLILYLILISMLNLNFNFNRSHFY